MGTYVKKGDKLRANKIEYNARKITRKKKINKYAIHKSQSIILVDNAECEIKKELKHYKKE